MQRETKIRLAIAEDHQLFREGLVTRLLKEPQFDIVAQFDNGLDLLTFLAIESVDVILMDINMPVLDGIRTTKRVVELFPKIKVVALTMYDNDDSIIEMLQAGAEGYLLKNANFSEIISAINDVVESKKAYCKLIHAKIIELISKNKYHSHVPSVSIEVTPIEIEIIKLMSKSLNAKEIGDILAMSFRTIENHKSRLFAKFDVKSAMGIVIYALKHKIITFEEI